MAQHLRELAAAVPRNVLPLLTSVGTAHTQGTYTHTQDVHPPMKNKHLNTT